MATVSGLAEQLQRLQVVAARENEATRALRQQQGTAAEIENSAAALSQTRHRIAALERQLQQQDGYRVPAFVSQRTQCENLIKRKFFVVPAYEIYGGVGGLYDFGPPGCALKIAVEAAWRSHFVLEEDMLEVSGPCLTPHIVLKTSGHVDRFTDLMVQDTTTSECFRADKYLAEALEKEIERVRGLQQIEGLAGEEVETRVACLEIILRQADSFSAHQIEELFARFHVKSPGGNSLSSPFPFNLMFGLKIGPKEQPALTGPAAAAPTAGSPPPRDGCGTAATETDCPTMVSPSVPQDGQGYLRPETAQGIFTNFRRLYEFVGSRMPFAAAQLGVGFRNEIAPRNGLLRVREFQMAEIEHFCHPEKKNDFPKFVEVADEVLPLFPRDRQLGDGSVMRDTSLAEAVQRQIIGNKTLAYFLARTFAFLTKVGILAEHIRFRQHLSTEMAHYASDCWDAEVKTSFGWIEVAGLADRSAFDLTNHSKASKVDLVAMERFEAPQQIEFLKPIFNKQLLGSSFKQRQSLIIAAIEDMSDKEKQAIDDALKGPQNGPGEGQSCSYELTLCDGQSYHLTRPMVSFERVSKTVSERPFIPSVIEPSFGIGRILHCIMEHSYVSRRIEGQEDRVLMRFPALIAPTKVALLPLSNSPVFGSLLQLLRRLCIQNDLTTKTDASSASIGKRYARSDELGTPYALTVDFLSLEDRQVTLRERDSMQQIRLEANLAVQTVVELCRGIVSWEEVSAAKQPVLSASGED